MKMRIRHFDIISYLLFATMIAFLGIKNYELTKQIENAELDRKIPHHIDDFADKDLHTDLADRTIKPFQLKSIKENSFFQFPASLRSEYVIMIFFSPFDCPTCFLEIPFWNQLFETYEDKGIDVVAITMSESPYMAKHFSNTHNIKIPTFLDEDGELFSSLGIHGLTPLKMLVNKNGSILSISKSTYNHQKMQEKYIAFLDKIANTPQ